MKTLYQMLLLVALWISPIFAWSNAIKIVPIRVELSNKDPVAILTVSNPDDSPLRIQAELVAWTQEQGEDHYQSSNDIFVVPPQFSVPPRQSQVIRLALKKEADLHKQLAYRLFLREIPVHKEQGLSGLQIALNMSIPVFVSPQSKPQTSFVWGFTPHSEDAITLTLSNQGNLSLLISEIQMLAESGVPLLEKQKVFKYVLPGQVYQWQIGNPTQEWLKPFKIKAKINEAEIIQSVEAL